MFTERFGLTKTMKITKVKEKFGYYIVLEGKRNWAVLPKNIPLKDLINIQKLKLLIWFSKIFIY